MRVSLCLASLVQLCDNRHTATETVNIILVHQIRTRLELETHTVLFTKIGHALGAAFRAVYTTLKEKTI